MKLFAILVLYIVTINNSFSQEKYFTNKGFISFYSHSPIEDITANNNQVLSVFDTQSNELVIYGLMKSFEFKKALMQEHFNENYVESDKYPKTSFEGKVAGYNSSNKEQTVDIVGVLSLHGKSKDIKTKASLTEQDGLLTLKGDFTVAVADYDIKIPRTVINNIAKTIKVSFDLAYKPYNK